MIPSNELEAWQQIVAAFKADDLDTVIESGGTGRPYLETTLPDGRVVLYGNPNGTWKGDVYDDMAACKLGDLDHSFNTHIRWDVMKPDVLLWGFRKHVPSGVRA